MFWNRLSKEEINRQIFDALQKNISYRKHTIMGVPGSFLAPQVLTHQQTDNDPFLTTLLENPNHIGCHTLGIETESFFQGTQKLEVDVIRLCAENIMQGKSGEQDGYLAGGGTESNIQALWVLRNYFIHAFNASHAEIGVFFSEDSSVSLIKGCDLLDIEPFILKVEEPSRRINIDSLRAQLGQAIGSGIQYIIVVLNAGSEMFGSVDDPDPICAVLENHAVQYKIHVDAGFGGFILPFTRTPNKLNFKNPNVTSIGMDAYKILRAPFGTSIFMMRKGFMQHGMTSEANYVAGKDHTLIGSRSGANAIAVWMILQTLGSDGLRNKMQGILASTTELCEKLRQQNIIYFHEPGMNIVAIKNRHVTRHIETHFGLVPDDVENPQWWRIVVMDHVDAALIIAFKDS